MPEKAVMALVCTTTSLHVPFQGLMSARKWPRALLKRKYSSNIWTLKYTTDPFGGFPSRRSTVYSTQGVLSSTSPLASQVGIQMLHQGGNAAVC